MTEKTHLQLFLSLGWYEEAIKFVFTFVAKTSELLLAAGIVISTANYLTDGAVMSHNTALADAWSWAQAVAIDSSLGVVFMNAFHSVRERDKAKAIIFFTLTALLAIVAGLVTHFDALGHATGLPVTDTRISGIVPVWVMTALRAIAVIGFLLASRLKEVSFHQFRQIAREEEVLRQEHHQEQAVPQIDYQALASALVEAMQKAGVMGNVSVTEEMMTSLPAAPAETRKEVKAEQDGASMSVPSAYSDEPSLCEDTPIEEPAEAKIAKAYETIQQERAAAQEHKPISARELALRAKVRRSTCSQWLKQYIVLQAETDEYADYDEMLEEELEKVVLAKSL